MRIRVDSWSCRPFRIPRGERGTGSEHPSQLGTERRAAGFRMSSMTGRSCLLLTSSSRIAFGVGLSVDVSSCGDVRASIVTGPACKLERQCARPLPVVVGRGWCVSVVLSARLRRREAGCLDCTWLVRVIASSTVCWRYSAQFEFECAYFESCRCAEFCRRTSIGGWYGVVFKTRPSCSVPASLVRDRQP